MSFNDHARIFRFRRNSSNYKEMLSVASRNIPKRPKIVNDPTDSLRSVKMREEASVIVGVGTGMRIH